MLFAKIIAEVINQVHEKVNTLVRGETNKIVINAPVSGGGYLSNARDALKEAGIKHITIQTMAIFEHDCIGEGDARFAEFYQMAYHHGLSPSDAIIFDIDHGSVVIPTLKAFEEKWLAGGGKIIHIVR